MCLGIIEIRQYPSNTTNLLLLEWQHVSTLQGHHQTFITNRLMLKSCVHFWDPQQCLQLSNTKGSCPVEIVKYERFVSNGNCQIRKVRVQWKWSNTKGSCPIEIVKYERFVSKGYESLVFDNCKH
jgi:hypothetical protein